MSLDLRQTAEYASYMGLLRWEVVVLKNTEGHVVRGFLKRIPLLGSVLKIQRYKGVLEDFTGGINPAIIYLEPLETVPSGFEKAKTCFVPSKTIQIDLTKSEKELSKNLKQKTRYNIKIAEKNGVVVKKSLGLSGFIKLWLASARARGMWLPQRREIVSLCAAFTRNVSIYLASQNGDVLGGLLIVSTPNTAYYMFAASTEEGKKLFAPTLLTWHAIRDAQKGGKKIFDFEGIYDERYENTKAWTGFTKFKEGFGGEVITYPGTFVKYSSPLLKILDF
ncbi:MAG: peptidoglycan bridge formation glycyltransferase FemA/FemB family protein [bacterium]|nr:peptidoglycan bridge formation glycyltransferase FemA/FemB family protein [bacterium]